MAAWVSQVLRVLLLTGACLSRVAEAGDDEVQSVDEAEWVTSLADPHLPPVAWPLRGNRVNLSLAFTDLKELNEEGGEILVYTVLRLSWVDPRYYDELVQVLQQGCTENASATCVEDASRLASIRLQRLFGDTGAFKTGLVALHGELKPDAPPQHTFWSPIPHYLQTTNEQVKPITEVVPFLYITEGINIHAIWVDSEPIRYDVKLDFSSFPFDVQMLAMCLDFDIHSQVQMVTPNVHEIQALSSVEATFEASGLSPHIGEQFLDRLDEQGFRANAVKVEMARRGESDHICLRMEVQRRSEIIVLRLFGPLLMLLLVAFAGFWVPLMHVMPRIATGFISFLTITVFRDMAYNMVPQRSSALLWMDVAIFCVFEIMFLGVIQNLYAEYLSDNVSHVAGKFVDKISRSIFPLGSVILLAVLYIMGLARAKPRYVMYTTQALIATSILVVGCRTMYFLRHLPQNLVRHLVHDLSDRKLLWQDGLQLDSRELGKIFHYLDKDQSGTISPEEIVRAFQNHGLHFPETSHMDVFVSKVQECEKYCTHSMLDLDGFRSHVQELFGGQLVRHLRKVELTSGAASFELNGTASGNGGEAADRCIISSDPAVPVSGQPKH